MAHQPSFCAVSGRLGKREQTCPSGPTPRSAKSITGRPSLLRGNTDCGTANIWPAYSVAASCDTPNKCQTAPGGSQGDPRCCGATSTVAPPTSGRRILRLPPATRQTVVRQRQVDHRQTLAVAGQHRLRHCQHLAGILCGCLLRHVRQRQVNHWETLAVAGQNRHAAVRQQSDCPKIGSIAPTAE